jgi:hypothetical protein
MYATTEQTTKIEQADKHKRKETTKITKKTAQEQNTNGKHAKRDHVKEERHRTKKAAKQNPLSI